uniref:LysM and putative peptidoglycan-binding domain-containing protein 4 n=1 Tax=Callorhinchus milii TaxID=7868 RepID=A0A4W3GPD7_CALMI|eukprot:gi/632938436/ref/XP_007904946.1/ PREDICTED: lysM and putative peptidoglycan-binding domain-containing protein 4 isoform X2 [Callorhinchus milii]
MIDDWQRVIYGNFHFRTVIYTEELGVNMDKHCPPVDDGLSSMMRLRDGPRKSFQAPVDVHTAQDGHTYLFGSDEGVSEESSNEDQENIELRPRVRDCQWASTIGEKVDCTMLFVREVVDGDNLNTFALQYGCTVADLKRVNNLIRDQDFFALKSIKIPVKRHSLLTEANEEAKRRHSAMRGSSNCLETFATDNSKMAFNEYFEEMDKDLEKIIQSTDNNLDEVIYPKTANELFPNPASAKEQHHGADWGIGWWNAVVIMLLVGIIIPVFYVVYFKMQETDDPKNPPPLPVTNTSKWQNATLAIPA